MSDVNERYARMALPCVEIGRALSCASDDEQAAVINTLAKELRIVCRDDNLSGMQLCGIAAKLNGNGKMFVRSLVEFVDLREKAEADDADT